MDPIKEQKIREGRKNMSKTRTVNLVKLYELFSNLQRGYVNMYHGRGGTYRIAEIFDIREPEEVEAFWAEVASVRGGLITPIRTLDYSVEDFVEPVAKEPEDENQNNEEENGEALVEIGDKAQRPIDSGSAQDGSGAREAEDDAEDSAGSGGQDEGSRSEGRRRFGKKARK
jgi:hypothetical protein